MEISQELFLKTYEDIKRINHIDLVSSDLRYAKTLEEMGELFQVYNKILGRKVGPNDAETIRAEILEETADVVQCIYSIAESRDFHEKLDFEYHLIPSLITNEFSIIEEGWSTIDWMDDIMSSISFLRSLFMEPLRVAMALDGILEMALKYDITLNEIHEHILEVKNPKWEATIEKLKTKSA